MLQSRRQYFASAAFLLAAALSTFQSPALATAQGSGGVVLPPGARPHGFSLATAAQQTAVFNTGPRTGPQPAIPFLMLTTPGASASFNAHPGEMLYVPLVEVDNSPPLIGDFPASPAGAISYFFGPSEVGAHDLSITVDGQRTSLGPDYLVGPVTTPPLADGGGTQYMTVATFLTPLTPGTHTVSISGELSGSAVVALVGGPFLIAATYTITVK